MKTITQKSLLFAFLSTIFFISSSSIPNEEKNDLKLINAEILSQGEDSPYPECVMEDGVCIKGNGFIYTGMAVAHPKK